MVKLEEIWPRASRVLEALGTQYVPSMENAARQSGLEVPGFFWMLSLETFEPEPVSPALLVLRAAYSAPDMLAERMANAAARGYLRVVDRGGYLLTDKGHDAAHAIVQAAYDCMAKLAPLEPDRLECLAGLLRRLSLACAAAPAPPGTWSIAHSRMTDPGPDAAVVIRIDQYLTDLAAYRDDAHFASWQGLGLDGPAWDALTSLWRQQGPLSLDELYDSLKRRGWKKEDYRLRLKELVSRKWARRQGDTYEIIYPGDEIRQQAEIRTDEYFYRPWTCLSPAELDQIVELLDAIQF